jgi:cytochrome P450
MLTDPDCLDIGRKPNEHIAFGGGGSHFCLGAHIARIEIQVMLHEILTRLSDIELAGPAEWLQSNFISDLVASRFVAGRGSNV